MEWWEDGEMHRERLAKRGRGTDRRGEGRRGEERGPVVSAG